MQICRYLLALVLMASISTEAAEAQSIGRWRLPSTLAQYCGYGYGPGHHAPIVRMPCYEPMRTQRLEFQSAPCRQCASPICNVSCEVAPYPSSCATPNCQCNQSPAPVGQAVSSQQPIAMPPNQIFAPPSYQSDPAPVEAPAQLSVSSELFEPAKVPSGEAIPAPKN